MISLFSILITLFFCTSIQVIAAPDEIQVYINDMNNKGEFGIEVHSNYVTEGATKPGYPGQLPPDHVAQFLPEFAYGITKNFEAGLYFPPLALAPNGKTYENGIRFRLKYIADPTQNSKIFWGLNTELGYSTKRVSETSWNLELRPIYGYKNDLWLISFNPIFETAVSGKNNIPEFEPCLKVARTISPGYMLGFEDFAGFGQTNHMSSFKNSENRFFIALDITKGKMDINFALGYGANNSEDKTLVKMIFSIPF